MSKMLDEIREQPATLERTLRREVKHAERFRQIIQSRRPRMVWLTARGTSDNAAQFGRYLIEIACGIPAALVAPSVFTLYQAKMDLKEMLVVGISQSGESTDINMVLERARRCGATTLGITNEAASSMAKLADETFLVRAGKERSVAATKTYTGQLLVLYLLAYALGAKLKLDDLARIPEWGAAALKIEPTIAELAERYRFMDHGVVVGRGLNYANAFEFALKMMETSYVVAERFSSADLLHGPVAMVERDFPVFLFAPSGVTWPSIRETWEKAAAVHAETLIFTDRANTAALELPLRRIEIPLRLKETFTPIPYIIPAQLFAASLATCKGLNPDQPRTLSKVTKTI